MIINYRLSFLLTLAFPYLHFSHFLQDFTVLFIDLLIIFITIVSYYSFLFRVTPIINSDFKSISVLFLMIK